MKNKKLLRLDCSSRAHNSYSRKLADHFESCWLQANHGGQVLNKSLIEEDIPHIQQSTIEGFHQHDEMNEATELSNALIAELKEADDILVSSPLYNLNIPSVLKAYVDQVVRHGYTFEVAEGRYKGLLEGKTAYTITTKGNVYKDTPMEQLDYQDPYLKSILEFMGISVKAQFSLEGTQEGIVEQEVFLRETEKIKTEIQKVLNE